ncbi:MAG TPA: hypothetical protein VGP04_00910 [Pseudonocardiaceae bacterium]|nr:hypothetical protein [Pseudonocardiaceae bacterium]
MPVRVRLPHIWAPHTNRSDRGMLWVLAVVAAQQSMKARTCAQQVEALDRLAQLGARRNALIPSRSAE